MYCIMKVYCILEGDCKNKTFKKIEEDELTKAYTGSHVGKILFCLECHRRYLENKYNVYFYNSVNILFCLFLGENENVLDLDLMFRDSCSLYNENINEDNFDIEDWIKKIKRCFYENCIFMENNYNLCEMCYYYNITDMTPK